MKDLAVRDLLFVAGDVAQVLFGCLPGLRAERHLAGHGSLARDDVSALVGRESEGSLAPMAPHDQRTLTVPVM